MGRNQVRKRDHSFWGESHYARLLVYIISFSLHNKPVR
jgi:hypothetical protein